VFGKKSGLAAMLFLPILMAIQISRHTKTGIKRVTFVESLTPVFGFGIQTHIGHKNRVKYTLCRNGNLFQNVDGRGALETAYFLACFTDLCYYCFSNNSRTVRLISPWFRTKKNSPKISANFLHLL